MEKNLGQVDLFHLQETEIFEDELNFFLSDVSVWEGFGTEKNLYESFSDEKKQALLFQYYNELFKQYYITGKDRFLCFFFLKKLPIFDIVFFQSYFVPGNFNVHAMNSVNTFLTESTSLLEQNICLKNEPSEFVTARKKNLN